jgi:hypothetical protein
LFRKSRRRPSRCNRQKAFPPSKPAWRVGFPRRYLIGINPLPPCGNRPPEMLQKV